MSKAIQQKRIIESYLHTDNSKTLKNRYLLRYKYLMQFASLRKRLFAFIADFILSSVFVSIIPLIVTSVYTQQKSFTVDSLTSLPMAYQLLCCLIAGGLGMYYFCIYPLKANRKGQTFGKKLFKIKVVKQNGQDVDFKTLVKRELIGSLIVEGETAFPSAFIRYLVFLLLPLSLSSFLSWFAIASSIASVLWCVFDKKRRMFHDVIAGTKVMDC